jgi:hypothetical protein
MREVSPALIELLRSNPSADVPRAGDEDADSPFRTVGGIMLWSAVGLAMWAGLFWLLKSLLH